MYNKCYITIELKDGNREGHGFLTREGSLTALDFIDKDYNISFVNELNEIIFIQKEEYKRFKVTPLAKMCSQPEKKLSLRVKKVVDSKGLSSILREVL